MDYTNLGIAPGRDPEYPSPIWAEPHLCLHPYEHTRLQAAHFPADIRQAVFRLDCFACGSHWDHTKAPDWVFDYLARMMSDGRVQYVKKDEWDIASKIERQRSKYEQIFKAETGDGNPITSSPIVLKRPGAVVWDD
ncbi:hypothetical protein HUO13_18505 [Saccharopolyspora erythraea]|uniref:hypothetical protein n=1 Tax=Saccharopolyspora erythraea TaxID=1836 RepID=UPI001BACFADF|nr:hypothetical protein [Saccharopolyspora erythraea]QUH02530.1 hypothetical protein HUO13_18505 [Saccharopolyspora erythraea]